MSRRKLEKTGCQVLPCPGQCCGYPGGCALSWDAVRSSSVTIRNDGLSPLVDSSNPERGLEKGPTDFGGPPADPTDTWKSFGPACRLPGRLVSRPLVCDFVAFDAIEWYCANLAKKQVLSKWKKKKKKKTKVTAKPSIHASYPSPMRGLIRARGKLTEVPGLLLDALTWVYK